MMNVCVCSLVSEASQPVIWIAKALKQYHQYSNDRFIELDYFRHLALEEHSVLFLFLFFNILEVRRRGGN